MHETRECCRQKRNLHVTILWVSVVLSWSNNSLPSACGRMWSQKATLDVKGQGGRRICSQCILKTLILLFSFFLLPSVHLLRGFCFMTPLKITFLQFLSTLKKKKIKLHLILLVLSVEQRVTCRLMPSVLKN